MKPSNRNRIYCPACNKHKLLFETEEKAMRFIKFNAEEMLEETGYAPIRAYFCSCCGGYHVTHQEKLPTREEALSEKLIEICGLIKDAINATKDFVNQITVNMSDIDYTVSDYVHLTRGYIKLANELSSKEHIDNYTKFKTEMNKVLINFIIKVSTQAQDSFVNNEKVEKFNEVKKLANMIKGLDSENEQLSKMCDDIIKLAEEKIIDINASESECDIHAIYEVKSLIKRAQNNLKNGNYLVGMNCADRAKNKILRLTGCHNVHKYISEVEKVKTDLQLMINLKDKISKS